MNSIKPLQRLQFVTVLITATTPNISGTCDNGSSTPSGSWSAGASTGSTYGQGGGQPFTVTTDPLPTTSLTKSCSTPTITIAATTPTTYTAVGGTMTLLGDDADRGPVTHRDVAILDGSDHVDRHHRRLQQHRHPDHVLLQHR